MKKNLKEKFKSRGFMIVLGFLVTALALWLSFKGIDWAELGESFRQVNLFWVALAVVNTLVSVYALGFRWKILLRSEGSVPLGGLFRINILSQCANIIIPARLGEILRVYLASKQYKISAAHVTGTVVIEKALDFFVFVALWIIVPPLFAIQEELKGYKLALLICVLTIGIIVFFVRKRESILKWGKTFSRILPYRLRDRFLGFFDKSIRAFGQLKSPKTLTRLFLWTLVFVGGQILSIYFLFRAFGLSLSIWVALFVLLATQVGTVTPSAPGKVGVFEYAVILSLAIFGVNKNVALSYGLLLHAVAYLPKILLGLVYFTKLDITPRKVYNLTQNESQE